MFGNYFTLGFLILGQINLPHLLLHYLWCWDIKSNISEGFFFLSIKLNNDITQCRVIGRRINISKATTFISLWGFPSGSVCKESTCKAGDLQEVWVWSLGLEDPLEEEMAKHSSILAWEIPWTEEPGGLQFVRFHKSWKQVRD